MSQRPVKEFKASRKATVAVWDNRENGYAVTIKGPSYKKEDGSWANDTSFWLTDLPSIIHAIGLAQAWIEAKQGIMASEVREEFQKPI